MKTAEQWYLSETMLFALKWTPERVMETVSAIQTDARVDLERELANASKRADDREAMWHKAEREIEELLGETDSCRLEAMSKQIGSLQSALRACAEAAIECGHSGTLTNNNCGCPLCVALSLPAVQAVLKK